MNLNKLNKYGKYSPLLLRTGIAVVFLWFGFSQLKDPSSWIGMIPAYAISLSPFSPSALVFFNGIFELVFATLLLLGLFTRFTSFILGLHLLHITTILGYGAIAARDFTLAIASFSIFLHGPDIFGLDMILWKKSEM